MPEKLRQQYENLDWVNFKKFETDIMAQGKNNYTSVNFKTKSSMTAKVEVVQMNQ